MYVRLWRRDGRISDRPATLSITDGSFHVEWRRDPNDRGHVILTALQVFHDNRTAWAAQDRYNIPATITCDTNPGPPENWTYRSPYPALAPQWGT